MAIQDDNPQKKVVTLDLSDSNGTRFIRTFVYDEDGTLETTFDIDINGSPFTPVGAVQDLNSGTTILDVSGVETTTSLVDNGNGTITYTDEDGGQTTVAVGGGSGTSDHGALTGLLDDDHTQYLTESRHDSLPSDNPHGVTASQVGLGNVPNIDATQRSNHTGTQLSSTISDFSQAVRDTLLTGISTVISATNIAAITATDTVLSAIGKLQARTALLFYGEFSKNETGLLNATTTEADFLTLNATTPVAGNYRIDWAYSWSGNDGAQDCIVRLYSGTTLLWEQVQEPKDTAGTGITVPNTAGGNTDSGTNQRHLVSTFDILSLPSGANEFRITLDSSGVGDNNTVYKGVIAIKKWGLN